MQNVSQPLESPTCFRDGCRPSGERGIALLSCKDWAVIYSAAIAAKNLTLAGSYRRSEFPLYKAVYRGKLGRLGLIYRTQFGALC